MVRRARRVARRIRMARLRTEEGRMTIVWTSRWSSVGLEREEGHGESLEVTGHWRRNQGEDETWLWGAKSEWYVPGTVHRNIGQGRARRDRS